MPISILSLVRRRTGTSVLVLLLAVLCGCQTTHRGGTLVDYLFPTDGEPIETPERGESMLVAPLRAGIAFVPGGKSTYAETGGPSRVVEGDDIGQVLKQEVLERMAAELALLPAFEQVIVLPATYLRAGGGLDDLARLRAGFDLDVLVLVSYDQVQHSETTFWSITYLLLLPMWFVPGEHLSTETFLDAAVFDLAGRSLLVRGDGGSIVEHAYIPVYYGSSSRASSAEGLRLATDELLAKLLPAAREVLPGGG